MPPEARPCWQSYLYNGGVIPEDNLRRIPPVFVGCSRLGSLVEVRENSQGDYEVIVDGTQVQRLSGDFQFAEAPYTIVNLIEQEWSEISQADDSALAVLQRYVEAAQAELPWPVARSCSTMG